VGCLVAIPKIVSGIPAESSYPISNEKEVHNGVYKFAFIRSR
jgi:hypothetical protein